MGEELKISKVSCLYLKPTYPLGQNFTFFLSHPEIEEFGLTPYKAGSNKMNHFRIILNKTTKKQLASLIHNSFESPKLDVAHPVLEMFLIADMAKKLINKNQDLPEYNQTALLDNIDDLREKTIDLLDGNILRNFRDEK